jgi:hypothetical protein
VIASARDTLSATQRVSSRVERIVDELEEPVLALKPGLARLAIILNDPAVDTVPDTLRKINEEVLPLVQGIQDTQTKVNSIATLAEETSTRLAGLPGAGFLLGRRRAGAGSTPAAPPTADVPEPGAPSPDPSPEPTGAPTGAPSPGQHDSGEQEPGSATASTPGAAEDETTS